MTQNPISVTFAMSDMALCNVLRKKLFAHLPSIADCTIAFSVSGAVKDILQYKSTLVFISDRLGDGEGFHVLKQFRKGLPFQFVYVSPKYCPSMEKAALKAGAMAYFGGDIDDESMRQICCKVLFNAEIYSQVTPGFLEKALAAPAIPEEIPQPERPEPEQIIVSVAAGDSQNTHDSATTGETPKLELPPLLTTLHNGEIVPDDTDHIWVSVNYEKVKLNLNSIVHIEAKKSYVEFYLEGKEKKAIRVLKPLQFFEKSLSAKGFILVHRSHLVNRKFIDRLHKGFIILRCDNNKCIPIAKNRFQMVKKILGLL